MKYLNVLTVHFKYTSYYTYKWKLSTLKKPTIFILQKYYVHFFIGVRLIDTWSLIYYYNYLLARISMT
jgi:uncharacterized protein with von Willebrand factor type A (vWA) domain